MSFLRQALCERRHTDTLISLKISGLECIKKVAKKLLLHGQYGLRKSGPVAI